MAHGKPQIRVALGTVEVTDTDRRAIAWEYDGDRNEKTGEWILNVERTRGQLASRDDCRRYLLKMGEHGLYKLVSDFHNAGGWTARREAGCD